MKSAEILSNTDRTSWSRIAMVWRFYLPYTRRKLILFTATAVFIEIFTLISVKHLTTDGADTIIKMMSALMTVLIGCSALVFAKPKGRELQAMLPALGIEKCVVLISYVTIIIPFIALCTSTVSYFFLRDEYPPLIALFSKGTGEAAVVIAYSILFLEGMALSCLWGVLSTHRKHAMRNGLLAVAGFYLGTMILIATISFCVGFYIAFTSQEVDFTFKTQSLFKIMTLICGIYVIFALIKCCHTIKSGQY